MHKYTFDVTLLATFHVEAVSEAEARGILGGTVRGAEANFGVWEGSGEPILSEVDFDKTPHLQAVDGESVGGSDRDSEDVELPGDGDPDPRDED